MVDIVSGWYSIERRAVTTIKCQWRRTTALNTGTARDGFMFTVRYRHGELDDQWIIVWGSFLHHYRFTWWNFADKLEAGTDS